MGGEWEEERHVETKQEKEVRDRATEWQEATEIESSPDLKKKKDTGKQSLIVYQKKSVWRKDKGYMRKRHSDGDREKGG